jgi:predicted peptidase
MNARNFLPLLITIATLYGLGCASMPERTDVRMGRLQQSFEVAVQADYLLYLPDEYQASQKEWPLMLFLHGAGERGNDPSVIEKNGPPKLIAYQKKEYPFIILAPQCPKGDMWSSDLQIDTLNALLDDIVLRYRIDKRRIYVTGLSMGGFGTFSLATAYPERFAAIAPICGGGDPKTAHRIAHLPIWVFHGAKDTVVSIEKSRDMVEALKKADSTVKFTVYPDADHNSWTETYNNPEIYEWLLAHSNSGDVK